MGVPHQSWLAVAALLIATAAHADMAPDATAQMFLDSHNQFRAQSHNLPPLEWDNELAEYAANYAQKRKGDCELLNSVIKETGPGENVYVGGGGDRWQPSDAVYAWGNQEMKYYNVEENECFGGECNHYLQVVWRDTTKLGCARVVCDQNRGVFMTCNYSPAGSLIGERPF